MKNKLELPHISTLKAELSVVKIGNKQMTISVFKQLYNEKCYDEKFNIIYPVWGKVLRDDIEYVIFQKGDELRKCEIPILLTKIMSKKDIYYRYFDGNHNGHWGVYIDFVNLMDNYETQLIEKGILRYTVFGSSNEFEIKFMNSLTNSQLEQLDKVYKQCLPLRLNRNLMVEELHKSRQLFIAV